MMERQFANGCGILLLGGDTVSLTRIRGPPPGGETSNGRQGQCQEGA